jgi:uncharacterized protein YrrD
MSRLVEATALLGLPVVTMTGDDVAEVRDVVYEGARGGLVGFTLNKRGFLSGSLREVLPMSEVAAVGRDAVMIDDERALTAADDAPTATADASPEQDVIGAPVITEEGTELGEVRDVVVSLGRTTKAVGYELGGPRFESTRGDRRGFIPLPEQIAISGDSLVVPAGIDRYLRDDLTGFGGAVDDFRREHRARDGTPDSPGSAGRNGAVPSKAELYEEARRRGVPGRSSMSKAELQEALERPAPTSRGER